MTASSGPAARDGALRRRARWPPTARPRPASSRRPSGCRPCTHAPTPSLPPCYGRAPWWPSWTRRPTLRTCAQVACRRGWSSGRARSTAGRWCGSRGTCPEPAANQVRVRVRVCGVCRTDLHLAEGDLPPHRPHVTPGHEIIGTVDQLGADAHRWRVGDRIGFRGSRIRAACAASAPRDARTCASRRASPAGTSTGGTPSTRWSTRPTPTPLPETFGDEEAAPLLCAGIIGYRALQRANLPEGGRLGIYGFGGSAHITAQVALARGARVHVMTRSKEAQAARARPWCRQRR